MGKNKSYVLLIVLIFSIIITLIGGGLALMLKQRYLSTKANILFNKLQKGAHYGINEAIRDTIQNHGICVFRTNRRVVDDIQVRYMSTRRGLTCFLRSEAIYNNAKAVKVAFTQSFYGIGTYTVKGNVDVLLNGGFISGCDNAQKCSIPGFVTSGKVHGRVVKDFCDVERKSGVLGNPPIVENVPFVDLTSLAFNVNCFREFLRILEIEYQWNGYPLGLGSNPLWIINPATHIYRQDITFVGSNQTCPDFRREDEADDIIGWMNINFPEEGADPEDIPNIEEACIWKGNTLNLRTDLVDCEWIKATYNSLKIKGITKRRKFIYAPNATIIIDNAGNATIITDKSVTINAKNTDAPLAIYSKDNININGQTTMVRIVSQGNIYINTSTNITNSTFITTNQIINTAPNMNFINVNVFARRIDFGINTRINIQGGMLYLYVLADQVRNNRKIYYSWLRPKECAWYGSRLQGPFIVGTPQNPTLIILINSVAFLHLPPKQVQINGILFGEGITYLMWFGKRERIMHRGILIRNFPNDQRLIIRIDRGFDYRFDYGIINTLNAKYWFVRRFDCIRDNPLPHIQAIQTLHSSY